MGKIDTKRVGLTTYVLDWHKTCRVEIKGVKLTQKGMNNKKSARLTQTNMSDAKSARSTQNIQDWHKRCKILNIEKWGKIHKKDVRLTKTEGLTPKVLNLHKLNIHKDIYIDKVGSNKSQKWRFRFKIDIRFKVDQCTKS